MSLPDRDVQHTYTEAEMQHVVARKMAEQQILQLQNGQLAIERKMVELVTGFNSKIESLIDMLQRQPEKMDKCRDDLKNEIKEEYPSKMDLMILENHMKTENEKTNKKIDLQWIKITVVVGTVVSVITVLGGIINYYIIISQFIKG
jgi:hypothetical protein